MWIKYLNVNFMEFSRIIHLREANTLAQFLSQKEREEIVSLKVTGFIGRKDFDEVLDCMCSVYGEYDEDDNFIPDYECSPAIRHLDLGESFYVDGDELPYFGFYAQLETFILPQGIKSTLEDDELQTGVSESDMLKTLVLPEGVKKVGGYGSCEKLTEIILPEGVEVIEEHAFGGCESITSVRIPSSVRVFNGTCFAGCNIEAYEVVDDNDSFVSIDGVVYTKDLKKLVAFPTAYPHKHFVVPLTTQIIGRGAFYESRIESLDLPDGLSVIEEEAFVFSKIQRIEMPDTVVEIGGHIFSYCFNLKHVRLSESLTTIPEHVFWRCDNLETVLLDCIVPPKMTGDVCGNEWIYEKVNLIVPKDAVPEYEKTPGWRNFIIRPNSDVDFKY